MVNFRIMQNPLVKRIGDTLMHKIEINNLYKVFGKNPEKAIELLNQGFNKDDILKQTKLVIALENVSFSVKDRETFVVMGLSGSGKSTLLRCINRLIEPTSGNIFVDKEDITAMTPGDLLGMRRKKLGMVFQSFALFPHLNVLDNAAYGLKVQGIAEKERKEKAKEALQNVGLEGWEFTFPGKLSGGMRQRVGLARALANDPDILLMDEAFSALDPLIRREMQDELIALQDRLNKTIIFITHDLDEALKLGDRIALMKDGKIIQVGTPEEILQSPASDYVTRFVEDVDKTKTLTASHVMNEPKAVIYSKDGPRVALRRMKENGISSIFVVDRPNRLLGLLTAEKAVKAIQSGNDERWKDNYLEPNLDKVSPDIPVNELFPLMAKTQGPVAVVSGNNDLLGVIVRGSIFSALTGGE